MFIKLTMLSGYSPEKGWDKLEKDGVEIRINVNYIATYIPYQKNLTKIFFDGNKTGHKAAVVNECVEEVDALLLTINQTRAKILYGKASSDE